MDDQQCDEMLPGRNDDLILGPDMLIDTDIDPIDEAGQVLTKLAQRAADCRRIEHGTRTGEVGIYLEIGRLPRTPGHEQIDCAVPARVASRGKGFADAGREIGRASCRERVCQYVLISGVAVPLKKKKNKEKVKQTREDRK